MTSPWCTLLTYCTGAERVVIAAPYMKADMLGIVLDHLSNEAEVECFTRWTPHDILVGSADTACRNVVIERGGAFYLNNRLHAKYYRFDERVLVGSANTTVAGLNYRQPGNLEILCEPGRSFDASTFENRLRTDAREVSEEELQFWLTCPVEAPTTTTIRADAIGTTFDDWKPLTRFPEYLWLVYCGQEDSVANREQRRRAQIDLATLRPPRDLTIERFYRWIEACLTASPFVDSVRKTEDESPSRAWEILANEWNLDRRAVARTRSTAQNWMAHFGLASIGKRDVDG